MSAPRSRLAPLWQAPEWSRSRSSAQQSPPKPRIAFCRSSDRATRTVTTRPHAPRHRSPGIEIPTLSLPPASAVTCARSVAAASRSQRPAAAGWSLRSKWSRRRPASLVGASSAVVGYYEHTRAARFAVRGQMATVTRQTFPRAEVVFFHCLCRCSLSC